MRLCRAAGLLGDAAWARAARRCRHSYAARQHAGHLRPFARPRVHQVGGIKINAFVGDHNDEAADGEDAAAPAAPAAPAPSNDDNKPHGMLGNAVWSFFGAFVGVGTLSLAQFGHPALELGGSEWTLLIGSFGATAALVYGAPASPLAQPRNVIGGHTLSAAVGVAAFSLLGAEHPALAAPLAAASATVAMQLTKTMHPPAAATALIAVLGGPAVHALGWTYPLLPCCAGSAVLVAVGCLVNNMSRKRPYPQTWW